MNANLPSLPQPQDKPTNLDDARIISDSQVGSYLTCERKHLFSYGFKKESTHPSRSLQIGIAGHEILAEYYRTLKGGGTVVEARQEAMRMLTDYLINGTYDAESLSLVQILISRYIDQDTLATGTRVLEVESDFFLPINEEFWYGMRLDLLVEATVGRLKGAVLLIDHKFTYDFYSPDDLLMNPQMAKYVGTVRFNGYPVHEAYLNQFRTRFSSNAIMKKANSDLFNRTPVGLSTLDPSRIRNALNTQIKASKRILDFQKMPIELWWEEALPVQNKMICRSCPFKNPCIMMEAGMPAQKALGGEYKAKVSGFSQNNEDSDG